MDTGSIRYVYLWVRAGAGINWNSPNSCEIPKISWLTPSCCLGCVPAITEPLQSFSKALVSKLTVCGIVYMVETFMQQRFVDYFQNCFQVAICCGVNLIQITNLIFSGELTNVVQLQTFLLA